MPSTHSSSRLDHKTVEALTNLLQEMASTVQTLSNRQTTACMGYKICKFQNESRLLEPNGFKDNLLHAQEARCSSVALHERCTSAAQQVVEISKMDSSSNIFEQETRDCSSGPNCCKNSANADTVDDLRCLLQEMKSTIHHWSIRHRLLFQGHAQFANENAGTTESSHFDLASERRINPPIADWLSSDHQVGVAMNKIQPTNERAVTLLYNPPIADCSRWLSSDHQVGVATNKIQTTNERAVTLRCNPPYSKLQSEACAQHKLPDLNGQVSGGESRRSQHSNNLNGESSKVVEQFSHVGQFRSYSACNRSVDGSLIPREFREGPEKRVTTTSHEMLPQISTPRVVKVVESPDWLPNGWITEVKTRASGSSAGTKDKYYFDPVSKRRFRSRREVFCFLTTGKLGRYKPKPKGLCNEGTRDNISSSQTIGTHPFPNKPMHSSLQPLVVPSHFVSSTSCPPSFSLGCSSDLFVPCKPSIWSDWLQENILNLSAPVHKHFQCSQPDAIKQEVLRLCYRPSVDVPRDFSSPQSKVNGNAQKDTLMHFPHGLLMLETEQHQVSEDGAGCSSINVQQINDGSSPVSLDAMQTNQPQDSGTVLSDAGDNSIYQHIIKLPNKIETSWLGKQSKISFAPDRGVAVNFPNKRLKKGKSHGKEVLEALGRALCQQGLSFLQGQKT